MTEGVGSDIFGEDYLNFYVPLLGDERAERESQPRSSGTVRGGWSCW